MRQGSTPWWVWGCADDLTPRDIANLRRFHLATFVWVPLVLLAVWVIRAEEAPEVLVLPTVALMIVVTGIVGVLWARFLNGADELTRKLQLEAMAAGFLLGLGSVLTVPLMKAAVERLSGPGWAGEALDFLEPSLVMPLTYIVVLVRAQRRMRG